MKCKSFISRSLLPTAFLFFAQVIAGQALNAQTVTGHVSDQEGQTLPGVNVTISGTTLGTTTDIKGTYSITVPDPGAILRFSFIGFRTVEEAVKGRTVIDIAMETEASTLDDVVVIGYGTVKKKDLTGSVAVVTNEELTRTPIANFSKALQGHAPGVVVMQNGAPGGDVSIRVRGIGSINFEPNPVYVIDGIIGGDINSLAPEDIESVSVLKDASAAAIYGANGANGVIIVTTKRGSSSGHMKVSLSAFTGTHLQPRYYNLMNADQYADFYTKAYELNGVATPAAYTDHFRQWYYKGDWHQGTDWQKEILQDNLTQNYYFNVSDGNERSNYSISANYYSEDGILINTNTNRINLRANSDYRIGRFIKVGETISLTRRNTRNSNWSAWGMALESSPLMNVYNENNNGGYEGTQIGIAYTDADGNTSNVPNTGGNDKFNPKGIVALPDNRDHNDGLLASLYAEIKPAEWLTFTTTPSVDVYSNHTNDWTEQYDMGVRTIPSSTLSVDYSGGSSYGLKNQLNFDREMGKHSIVLSAIQDVRMGKNNSVNVDASDFPYPQLNVISQAVPANVTATGGEGEWTEAAYLARLIYNYSDKYLVTMSVRRDGSSNFGPKQKWGTFPSFSFAWKVNEDFFQNVEEINMLKLRFGWGQTGNSDIGGFRYQTTLAEPIHFSPVFGLDQTEAYAINELWTAGNPYVKWEAADMLDFGLDLNAFRNRVQFSSDYYIKTQYGLLLEVPISRIFGKWDGTAPVMNIGDIRNSGFEFDLKYSRMEGLFNYKVYANLTTVKNEVISVPSDILTDNNITSEGHTIGSIYGYVAERIIQESDFNEDGKYLYALPVEGTPAPGDLMFRDLNNDGKINDLDRTVIGKGVPDFTYSFGGEIYFKNVDLSVFFYGAQNADVYNTLRRDLESFEAQDLDHNKSADWAVNYWTPENKSTKYVRADPNDSNRNTRISTWWVEDASFLRLKDIQAGYTLPRKLSDRAGLSRVRVYVSAMNLLTFTRYNGYDPESPLSEEDPTTPGVDASTYPIPRTFTAGIQIEF